MRSWREAETLQEIASNPWIDVVSHLEKCDAAALEELSWLHEYCIIAVFGGNTC